MKLLTTFSLLLFSLYILSGCTAAVVGGAVATTSVVLDKRTTGDYVEDQNIKAKFTYIYSEDTELSDATHINVTSYNLRVLITGETPTEQQKQKVGQIVDKIQNVRKYFNEVRIAEPTTMSSRSNDSYLTAKIKSSIFSHFKELDGAQVKVVTEYGSVYLMGLVSREQGNQITEIVRKTNGVKRVIKLFEYPNPNNKKI